MKTQPLRRVILEQDGKIEKFPRGILLCSSVVMRNKKNKDLVYCFQNAGSHVSPEQQATVPQEAQMQQRDRAGSQHGSWQRITWLYRYLTDALWWPRGKLRSNEISKSLVNKKYEIIKLKTHTETQLMWVCSLRAVPVMCVCLWKLIQNGRLQQPCLGLKD